MKRDYATIISGLCRSGTSMLMKMVEAGGIEPFMDAGVSQADKYNPFGYYEADVAWEDINDEFLRKNALGKAIKVVVPYIKQIEQAPVRVIYTIRNLADTACACESVAIDLVHPAYKPCTVSNLLELSRASLSHLAVNGIPVKVINFDQARRQPIIAAAEINEFLGGLDVNAMAQVVKSPETMKEIRRRWHETAQ